MKALLAVLAILLPASISKLHHEIVDADQQETICKDTKYYLDRSKGDKFKAKKNACPTGYVLAKLDSPSSFSHAAIFLFGCLGPAQDAWISTSMGTVYAEGDPLKITAPDAIEKGGPIMLAQGGRKNRTGSTIKSKHRLTHHVPSPSTYEKNQQQVTFELSPGKIRTVANVHLDSPDSVHPFLCQLISASDN
jgi:hypothetical protein